MEPIESNCGCVQCEGMQVFIKIIKPIQQKQFNDLYGVARLIHGQGVQIGGLEKAAGSTEDYCHYCHRRSFCYVDIQHALSSPPIKIRL